MLHILCNIRLNHTKDNFPAMNTILSLLANHLTVEHIERVRRVMAMHTLEIKELSLRSHNTSYVEAPLYIKNNKLADLKSDLLTLSTELCIDIVLQEDNEFRCNRRLICFDMDSTLIKVEVIDELAKYAGVGEEVAQITELAMQGKLDFNQSFTNRMSLLAGLSDSALTEIADQLPIMEGAERLFKNLNAFGYKTAILSGGFNYFGKVLQKKFNIDYVFSNTLDIKNKQLTGKVIPPIINGEQKELLLREIAEKEELDLKQTVAVGDGANDLAMIGAAGLGIAYHAKPIVRETAKQSISHNNLDSILYLLGHSDSDLIS